MTLEQAEDLELFTAIPWMPWRWSDRIGRPPSGDRHDEVPVELKGRIDIGMQVPVRDLPEGAGRRLETIPRQTCIRRNVELKKYGFSPGCPGCIAAETGSKPTNHSDICRARIEAEMQKDEVPGGGRDGLKTRLEQGGLPASQGMDVEPDEVRRTKRSARGDLDDEADRKKGPGERSDGNTGTISEEATMNVDPNKGMNIEQLMQVFGVETEDDQDRDYLNLVRAGMGSYTNPGVVLDLGTGWDLSLIHISEPTRPY